MDWTLIETAIVAICMGALLIIACIASEVIDFIERKRNEKPVQRIATTKKHYHEDDWVERIMKD